jgi:pyruvate/2-oxoglutarate dehydrogenase complex dihydrolipoamide dehydrogenase (E3) component
MSHDYDAIIIGGGAAGLTASGIAANAGAKTLMIERHRLGGDCTWTGCIPSKSLLEAARIAHQSRSETRKWGIQTGSVSIDFSKLMDRVRSIRQEVYEEADRPEIFEDMGIEVVFGEACFTGRRTLEITDSESGTQRSVTGRKIIICTGSRAMLPPVDGLRNVPYITNETLFELEEQPEHMTIIGAGPIGVEMAQAFNRLGTEVTLVERMDQILSKDHPELTPILKQQLRDEGVDIRLHATVTSVAEQKGGRIAVAIHTEEGIQSISTDQLLVATGRRPNLESLDLAKAGVKHSKRGIAIDKRCRTSQRHIYAAGDVTGRYQFTHMSEHMAKVAASNAFLKVPLSIDEDHVPWCTYTEPQMAHVGATEQELRKQNVSFQRYRFPYDKLDRALAEGKSDGWIYIYAKSLTGKILGASILGEHAGELIGEVALAMRNGISLRNFSDTIHPYPTYLQGNRRAADQWYIQSQSPALMKALKTLFRYQGEVPDDLDDPDRIV